MVFYKMIHFFTLPKAGTSLSFRGIGVTSMQEINHQDSKITIEIINYTNESSLICVEGETLNSTYNRHDPTHC